MNDHDIFDHQAKMTKPEKEKTIFMKGMIYVLHDFSWWTSTHGVPHIGLANARWLRIFWIFVVLACLGGFIWQLTVLLKKYLSYSVNTETALHFSERVFPTVTLCHLNPWKKDEVMSAEQKMKRLVEAYENLGINNTEYGFSDRLDGDRQQRAAALTLMKSERLHSKPSTSKIAYNYADLVISCTYNAKLCELTDFRNFYDSTYGVCQTFNFKGNYTSSKAGPLFGLRMVIRTDQAKYLPWTETAGMVIAIHGKDEMPYPDVLGYFAPPGTATSIGVRFVKTERLPNPYGTCTTQTVLEEKHYKGPYEVESCFRNCLQEKIIKNCGCYDPEYPHANDSTIPSCDTVNDTLSRLDCIERISNADSSVFDIIKECNCPQPCSVESYAATVSTAKWPSKSFKPTECMSEAADLPWKQLGMSCIEWYNSNTLLVEIYYERMNHQVLTESPSYSLVNLVSDIGGQVGLFLGMSIISLLEFATLILLLCCYCGTHKSRKRDIEEIENRSKLSTEAERNRKAANKRKGIYEESDATLPPSVTSAN